MTVHVYLYIFITDSENDHGAHANRLVSKKTLRDSHTTTLQKKPDKLEGTGSVIC